MKDWLPVKPAQRGLKINESKTEEYTIKRANCDNRWKDCNNYLVAYYTHKMTLKKGTCNKCCK